MRIVDLKTFITLPEGTVYCKYGKGGTYGEIAIKGDVVGEIDFGTTPIFNHFEAFDTGEYFDKLVEFDAGKPLLMSTKESGRDGLFNRDQLYCIYSKEDLKAAITELSAYLAVAEPFSEV